jgi:ATP-binding cassette subfamily B protein
MTLPQSALAFVFHFVRKQWLKFAVIIFSFVVWAVSDAIFPYFIKRIVNTLQDYQGERSGIYVAIGGTLLLLVLFWFSAEFFMRVQGITQIYTFPRFRANIRDAVFNYATSHSHEYFSSNFAGNLVKKLTDLSTSCQTIIEIICFNGITALTGTTIVLVMMWQTNPLFAAILAVWIGVHFCIIFFFFQRGNTLSAVHADAISTLSGKVADVFSNMLNVRLFARSRFEMQHLKKCQDDEMHKAKQATWVVEKMRILLGINGLAMIFGMIFGLLYGWVHHWVTLGDFTQVLMQSFWLLGWLWYISFQMSIFSRELGTVNSALSLVNQPHDLTDKKQAPALVLQHGDLLFNKVCFAYNSKRHVFENLSVTIPAGQKIGLVGFSGSGKTTFVNLILRFYDIQSGSITIDQQNIADVTQDSLRSHIAMIPQDPGLFHRSLMENIRYGRLDASDEEVMHAAKLAHCDEFIEKLDGQYDALVGERGIKLSGGQRQRIAIARALLKNAPIFLLDEATSALDSMTEKHIQASLKNLMKNRTTIVIAHRLSTLADMDRILVFHQGAIIEEGTKDSLLTSGGHFATLWKMQTNGFLPEN